MSPQYFRAQKYGTEDLCFGWPPAKPILALIWETIKGVGTEESIDGPKTDCSPQFLRYKVLHTEGG